MVGTQIFSLLQLKKTVKYLAFSLVFERTKTGIVNGLNETVWAGGQGLTFESEDLGSCYTFLPGFVNWDMVTSLGLPYFLFIKYEK